MIALLEANPLPMIRGQREPELLGWVSREAKEMLPTYTGGFEVQGVTGTFATLLWLGSEPPIPDGEHARSNQSGRRARFRWTAEDEEHRLSFARDEADIVVEYRTT
jgi:hypothetical protein